MTFNYRALYIETQKKHREKYTKTNIFSVPTNYIDFVTYLYSITEYYYM